MSDLHEKFHPRNRRWPSGMPESIAQTQTFTRLTCNRNGCEYSVVIATDQHEATLREHHDKSCPLVASGTPGFEEAKEAKHNGRHEELVPVAPLVRTFETGATRDTDDGKLDYEGFLSPLALERFAQFMHKHRHQSDGALRDSDNWQKGIPIEEYVKSHFRHFMEVWATHRGWHDGDIEEALCADIFNAMGHLHELLKEKHARDVAE